MTEGMHGWLSAWKDYRVVAEEYRELDNERVVALVHFSGRGQTSGLELRQMRSNGAILFYVRGGKVTRLVAYHDREHALADLGLAPEAGSMSEENLAVVREIYRAFADHRFPAEYLAEEFAWETHPDQPGAGTYRGHEAVRAYFRDWVGGWHDVKSNVERLIDREDQVVALIHGSYRLSTQGLPIEDHYAHVWTLHEGKAVHARATGRTPEELGFRINPTN
jgi:ketosteroid isomerase-like protein